MRRAYEDGQSDARTSYQAGFSNGSKVTEDRLRAGLEVALTVAREATSLASGEGAPKEIGWEEAARLKGCSVAAMKSRVNRGMYAEAVIKIGGKRRDGKKGGNAGSLFFDREKLLGTRRGGR